MTASTTTDASNSTARTMRNHIGGDWVSADSARTLPVYDPASQQLLARLPDSSAADVERAIAAAQLALPTWRATPVLKRAKVLFRFRELLAARSDEIAELLSRDSGKSLVDTRAEMGRTLETLECATALPQTMQGSNLSQIAGGIDAETFRQPVGVCAAITPFNFPAMLTMWFLPFAIGCGNTFVLKPSEQTPLVPELFFELLDEAGVPPGVVNLVHGGKVAVNAILGSPDVAAVSFVGSAQTAAYVYERAAATGKRVQAFGGAKNFMVLMPDAVIDATARNIASSAFGGAGQRCMAGSVIISVGDTWRRLRDPLLEVTRGMRVGAATDPTVDFGPLVSAAACARVTGTIKAGIAEGATLTLDGRQGGGEGSAFVGPTIFEDVTPAMKIGSEEIFGPVLSVIEVDSFDAAIEVINKSRYGNGTSIFTESGAAARRFREEVEVGMIGVNIGVAAPIAYLPFGGWKASFLGDVGACGRDAIDFYTRKKTVTSRWFAAGPAESYFVEG